MRKTILILSILALIASGCGKTVKVPFELGTFPSEWRNLSNVEGKLMSCEDPFEILKIDGNKLIRIYYARGEQSDFESEIVASYQIGDTIVISTKPANEEFVWDYKFLWLDKEKGLGEWIFNSESDAETFVVNERVSEYPTFTLNEQAEQAQKTLKYLHNGFGFFDDGTCVSDINSPNPEFTDTYHEFPTLLVVGKHAEWNFFDDFGHITSGWEILNFHKVNSRMQITNFETNIAQIDQSKIQDITETCLIFITPKNNYEEWVWYRNDREEEYSAKGIPSIDAKKQYLSFELIGGEGIIINTKKEQNGKFPPSALLYKKGQIPIMISISGESDDGNEMIEEYLRESGDGKKLRKRH